MISKDSKESAGVRLGQQTDLFDEHVLQYMRPGESGEAEIVIGFDFGTSASKVVIQVPGLPGNPAYAVEFGNVAHQSMQILLPTQLWVTQAGECTLRSQPGSRLLNDIKLELFTEDEQLTSNRGPRRQGVSPEAAAVAYLALALRRAREWFLTTKRAVVGHVKSLIWSMNLGVPSPCSEDNEANRRFRRVGKAAWMLSVLGDEITIPRAEHELRLLADAPDYWERDELACDFDIVPEIVAGAIGYAATPLRREGLHVMIDVGASTVDICSFVLHDASGNDRYSLLTADVQPFGTIRLHQDRIRAVQRVHEFQAQDLRDKHDPLAPITEDLEEYILPRGRILEAAREAEKNLRKLCQTRLWRVISDLRKRRDPHSSVWRGRLPILLIGGGGQLQFFRSLVEEMDQLVMRYMGNEGTVLLPVDVPNTVSAKPSEQNRLAVAWGLSHQTFNIGDIIPPDQISDIEPSLLRDWEVGFVSKDQM